MVKDRWSRQNAWTLRNLKLSFVQSLRLLGAVAAGTVGCAFMFFVLDARNEDALRTQVKALAHARMALLHNSAERSLDALRALRSYLEVAEDASRQDFRSFVTEPLRRLPEVQAFEWIPRVLANEREQYEAAAWRDGYSSFEFTELGADGKPRTAAKQDTYYPVYYVEPLELNLPALGLDLASDPVRRAALERARVSGEPVATAAIRLAQETAEGQRGLLVYMPVHRASAP
ncbi:MAG TPA: CHASE domain-containing protein, partial [Polyangiales bacterium]|nr:CHASE domain-containing protein [Polyangiales bacterium]